MEVIVNFKNYIWGKKSLDLTKKIKRHIPKAIICVSPIDVRIIENHTKARIFSQNVDLIKNNKSTGFINPNLVKDAKAEGTLLNHSEHKIPYEDIREIIKHCKKINLKVIVCASTLLEVKKLRKLNPWAIAYEEPKLISTKKSVTKYSSGKIKEFIESIKGTRIIKICGAGINSIEDIIEAKKLGCEGVLISSAIANTDSKKAEKFLRKISQALK